MKLYSYWRSSTAYRVRTALNLKGVAFETVPVDLVAGDQRDAAFLGINPSGGVPALQLDDGTILTQSMAILEWLEDTYPAPAMLPADPVAAAQVRAAAMVVACDIHPVNNLKVVQHLKSMGHSQDDGVAWMCDWMHAGLTAFQELLPDGSEFCFGDAPGLADICLIPQLYNAQRWGLDLAPFARLTEIEAQCLAHPAFDSARPENQPDAA